MEGILAVLDQLLDQGPHYFVMTQKKRQIYNIIELLSKLEKKNIPFREEIDISSELQSEFEISDEIIEMKYERKFRHILRHIARNSRVHFILATSKNYRYVLSLRKKSLTEFYCFLFCLKYAPLPILPLDILIFEILPRAREDFFLDFWNFEQRFPKKTKELRLSGKLDLKNILPFLKYFSEKDYFRLQE